MKTKLLNKYYLLTAIISLIILCSVSAYASDKSAEYLFDDNFEQYELGDTPGAVGNPRGDSWAPKYRSEWGTLTSNSFEVISDSEVMKNKVLKAYNDTDKGITATALKSVLLNSYRPHIQVDFRIRPMNSKNVSFSLEYIYGDGLATTPLSIRNGAVYCQTQGSEGASLQLGYVESDKWNEITVKLNYKTNRLELSVNGNVLKSDLIFSEKRFEENPNFFSVYFKFNSELNPGQSAYWDDISITELNPDETKIGNILESQRGKHPRLIFGNSFEKMKELSKGALKPEWESLKKYLEEVIDNGAPEYEDKLDGSNEDLWMRDVAEDLKRLCTAYKISGNEKYKKAANEFALKLCSYPSWGRSDIYENSDLAASHAGVSLAIYYDWLFDEISSADKTTIRNTLLDRFPAIYNGGWQQYTFMQNHLWNSDAALLMVSVALYDECPEVKEWITLARHRYNIIISYLSDEGYNYEGLLYSHYGHVAMNYYLSLAEKYLCEDFSDILYFDNFVSAYIPFLLPEGADGEKMNTVNFGDSDRKWDYKGLGVLSYFASRNRDEVAQWYVNRYLNFVREKTGNKLNTEFINSFLDIFYYYDDELEEMSPQEAGYPTDLYLKDLGFVISRTGWNDNETVVAYRCGPIMGAKPRDGGWESVVGLGHAHGDVNSPIIYSRGDYILADDGYAARESQNHNTLIVGNVGQTYSVPEEEATRANPQIIKYEVNEEEGYVYSIGDAQNSDGTFYLYDKGKSKLEKFQRHFLYLKPDILIVIDDVETGKNPAGPIDIRFFPTPQGFSGTLEKGYTFINNNSQLTIKPFVTEEGVFAKAEPVKKTDVAKTAVHITTTNQKLIQPTVLSWSDKDKKPVDVTMIKESDSVFVFYTNKKSICIDIANRTVSCEDFTGDINIKVDGVLYTPKEGLQHLNDRYFIEAEDASNIFGFEYEIEHPKKCVSKITMTNGSKTAEMSTNERKFILNGKEFNGEKPYVKDDKVWLPIRFVAQCFDANTIWSASDLIISIHSDADFKNAELTSLNVNGKTVYLKPDVTNYKLNLLGEKIDIMATPLYEGSAVKIIPCAGMFGKSIITVTSLDGTVTKDYHVITEPVCGIGNLPVHNISYSSFSTEGYEGDKTLDNDFSTMWSATGIGETLTFDLGVPRRLDSVVIAYSSGNLRKAFFKIQISHDGINFSDIASFASSGDTLGAKEYKLNGERARYVRYYAMGTDSPSAKERVVITEIGFKGGVD